MTLNDLLALAGSRDASGERLGLVKKYNPKCAFCLRLVTFEDGMHIFFDMDWRMHISCASELIERRKR